MDEGGVVPLDGSIQMRERAVEIARPSAKDRALHRQAAMLAGETR
jgi:hypothetical protein